MGFANPIKPIDYERIERSVEDGAVDYDRVRQACDVALQSTDTAIAAIKGVVDAAATATALQAARDQITAVKAVVDAGATATALAGVRTVVDSIKTTSEANGTEIAKRALAPTMAAWTAARNANLAALAAINHAITAFEAAHPATDTSAEYTNTRNALIARRSALYDLVKAG